MFWQYAGNYCLNMVNSFLKIYIPLKDGNFGPFLFFFKNPPFVGFTLPFSFTKGIHQKQNA